MNCQIRKMITPLNQKIRNDQPTNHKETLTQEQKVNLVNLKWIMSIEKTTVSRNMEWKTVKREKIKKIKYYMIYQRIIYPN